MRKGTLKEEEVRLKSVMISNLEGQFVDQFEKWKSRLDIFNGIISEYNEISSKRLRKISYDQFCKFFIIGSKALLDDHIKMYNIIPTQEELMEMKSSMIDPDDADEFKQKYTSLLEIRYSIVKKTLANLWDGHVFKYIVTRKYGRKHYEGILAAKISSHKN